MITTDRRKVLGDIRGTAYDCVLVLSLTGLADCRSNKTSNFDKQGKYDATTFSGGFY